MENKAELRDIIINNMQKHNLVVRDFDGLRPNLQEQLLKIELYFQGTIEKQKELAKSLKEQKLSLANVCEDTSITRSTVYNNADILKRYIEGRISDIEKDDILSLFQNKKTKEEMEFLKGYLERTQVHLMENDVLQTKIKELEKEVTSLNKINQNNSQEISRLINENEKLKYELSKNKSTTVVNLKSNTV